ncbi:glycerophosphodiester phosphodiesterase [Bdellovibrio sp. HCB209]|uniref:glycerophosphodiester phosphodiesterase n=1 Tax=Bdellovibrio sp. HCB209 TaxID=3394354 RepID=UPI0039B5AF0B
MIYLLLLIIVLVGIPMYQHFNWKAQPWPQNGVKTPKYQGHRGYWKEGAQENTLASFKAAKARGLQMIEVDVHLSGDGEVIVLHDADLKRVAGDSRTALEFTAQELKTLAQVPTLREILQSPDVPQLFNIELKTNKAFDHTLEEKVVAVVKETKTESRVLFSTFNPLAVRALSKLAPQIPRALLATKEQDPANRWYLKLLIFAPYIKANILHLDHRYVSVEDLKKYIKRGVPVSFWTVNEQPRANELLANGAHSIITDTLS